MDDFDSAPDAVPAQTTNDSTDDHRAEPRPGLPVSRRRALASVVGLGGLGLLSGSAQARHGGPHWRADVDADGNQLLNLGALEMVAHGRITDFAGENLEIDDGVLNAIVAGDDLNVGRYLDFDNDTLTFTGPAEWENETTTPVNEATGENAVVAGGSANTAEGTISTVSGGRRNDATGIGATVGGGGGNEATAGVATVSGGTGNEASGTQATVGGGGGNEASGDVATVGGGSGNRATGSVATISGGQQNEASGELATVVGGFTNSAAGDFSFVAGRAAKANHDGAFVVGDSSNTEIRSAGEDEARFQMEVFAPEFNTTSARSAKTNIEPVDPSAVLAGVESLEISTWELQERESGRHMGPMAADFADAFSLGDTDESIATVDADGVAFAAIQGLATQVDKKDQRLEELEHKVETKTNQIDQFERENETLRERCETLESRLTALEERVADPAD